MFRILILVTALLVPLAAHSQEKLPISEILAMALRQSPTLEAERQNLNILSGERLMAFSPENPTVFIERSEIRGGTSNDKSFGVTQNIRFPLDYYYTAQKFGVDQQMLQNQFEIIKSEVLIAVHDVAIRIIVLEQQSQFLQKNRELFEKVHNQNQKRLAAGEIDKLPVLKSRVALGSIDADIKNLELEKTSSLKALQNLVGTDSKILPDDQLPVDTTLVYSSMKSGYTLAHPGNLISNLKIRQRKVERSMAITGYFPDFEFTLKSQNVDRKDFWGFEIGLTVPLWLTGPTGELKKAKHNALKSNYEKIATENAINSEFENLWGEYTKARNNLVLYSDQLLPEAYEIFSFAEKSYKEGQISYLEFVDSYRIQLETQNRYLETLAALNSAAAKLHRFNLTGYLSK